MQKQILLIAAAFVLAIVPVYGQKTAQDSTYRKYFIGRSLFMLANLNLKDNNKPDFYLLNLGYRITPKNVVSIQQNLRFCDLAMWKRKATGN